MVENNIKKYQGYIGVVGKPNVGKSSLINAINNKKVLIVNNKPQTTRNNIRVIYNNDDFNVLFIDTPGYHKPKNKLDIFLNQQAIKIIQKIDLIYFLYDPLCGLNQLDEELINLLKTYNKNNIILIITKNDLIKNNVDNEIDYIKSIININDVIYISSKEKHNINELLELSKKYLTYSYQNEFKMISDWDNDEFLIKEIIREKCLELLDYEIPHSVNIEIEKLDYNPNKNIYNILANIIIEKESQKPIMIGKNGSMIKQIGVLARKDLLSIYDCKINLQLFVKVDKNWRNNESRLKIYGYQ